MGERTSFALAVLMLTSLMSVGMAGLAGAQFTDAMHDSSFDEQTQTTETNFENAFSLPDPNAITDPNPWIEETLWQRIEAGQVRLRVTVITKSLVELGLWQFEHGQNEKQTPAGLGETLVATDPTDGQIDHRTFWMDAEILHKMPAIPGIIAILDAQNAPQPYDTTPFRSPDAPTDGDAQSESVRTGEIHGANEAWENGYAGEGIVVAVADTGVDFGHPDLDGTQARISDGGKYDGWPMMFDHNSMYYWLVSGQSYPARSTWYADTSTLDWDNDSNGVLDLSGHNITGIAPSLSGIYHLGEHPDGTLRNQMGGDVPILVVDSRVSGLYETVIPDINRNSHFGDDENMTKGNETAGLDEDGDGIRDVSAGLLYWISDGLRGVPYAETYAARHGYSNRIASAGNLTLFMLDSGSHGTLCASAVAAQGVVSDGKVKGMAPNATIAAIGNHYSGGHALDGWRWIAEGIDGNPATFDDQPDIGSFSFGYSSIDDSGADAYSLYLDWLTRVHNNQTTYAVAIGNGGHGFGTTKVPGASQGIFSVGAFSSRSSSGSWGQTAPWSNRGPNVVGRMDPDIVAVGWSATGDIPLNSRNNGNSAYTTWGGTSLATPITAGLLALVAQAWWENLGERPHSQTLRDYVLSTADDRGYEPFIQGGGWFNASRATATLSGENGSWWASPAQWNTGTFQGQHRDANINAISQGESQTVDVEFSNTGSSDIVLEIEPQKFEPLSHFVTQWLSIGNGSEEGDNNTWDGYQGSRPDILIPIHVVNNTTYQLPDGTKMVRARAMIEYAAFDDNLDRSSDERAPIEFFRWTDTDGDGIWVEDYDNDSMVDADDWTESSELEEITYWWSHGPQAEVRVGNPFEDMSDGLFLGIWRSDVSSSGLENVSIEYDWTAFGATTDEWVTTPQSITIPANTTFTSQFTVAVPQDAPSGLRQHGLHIQTFAVGQNGSIANQSHRDWTLPIVTNVPWSGPFNLLPKPLDGNVSNQTLYTESWISGAQRWNWRAESGDWRFLTVDWPEELDTGGTVILDVDWADNPWTDIDVLWLSQKSHGYADEDPDAYGDSTFWIESRSVNNHRGSGRHNWGTYTGESREVFVVPSSAGLHQMVLHTALHGVPTNDNALNISVGYVAAEQSGFHKVVTDWSEASGNETVHVVSTIPMPLESVRSFGWTQPIHFPNETAYQDDSGDKMSASWWYNFSVEDAAELSVRMNAHDDADLDLFLFRDADGDGVFESGEEIQRSTSATSAETVMVDSPVDGNYSVAVQGWSVPSDTVQFWIDIEVVAGDLLSVSNSSLLNASQIAALWPNGSETLAGAVPEGALELTIQYQMPEAEGTWTGFVEVSLEGGINMRMPFTYELVDLDPELDFVTPENLTETNAVLPLALHARDIGSGFSLDDLSWAGLDNNTSVPNATSVEAMLSNLSRLDITSLWNSGNHSSNLTFREVWINATLPAAEQWHEYGASLADISGRSAADWLSVKFDTIAPIMILSHIPWITNESILLISVQTESDAVFRHNGEIIPINETGFVEYTVFLEESEIEFLGTDLADEPSHIYYATGENSFSLSVTDPSGNRHENSWRVVLDSTIPDIQNVNLISLQPEHEYLDQSWLDIPLNLTVFITEVILSDDVKSMCITIEGEDFESIEQCLEYTVFPYVMESGGVDESTSTHPEDRWWNLTDIPDDSYNMVVELVDWAGNSYSHEYSLILDRTLPEVDWDISPSGDGLLSDHRLGLSWTASENVELEFTHNGELVEEWNASYGGLFFDLNETGYHEFCIDGWDVTRGQHNENRFHECQEFTLMPSLYASAIWANWDGTTVGTETVQLILQRGPDQWANVTHIPLDTDIGDVEPTHSFEPGQSFVTVELALDEGENEFYVAIGALDHIQMYTLYVTRDTITPRLNLTEITNRTTNLEPTRIIEGVCERGAFVTVWTEISTTNFVCGATENFTLQMGIPARPGWHSINATSVDLGGNSNEFGIEVRYQEWTDWAVDDAKAGGPMLYWGAGALLGLLAMLGLTSRYVRRRGARASAAERGLDAASEWLDEMVDDSEPEGEGAPVEPTGPAEPLPEEEELRAWARGEREVRSWRDSVPDDDVIDLD
jgi:subtilisin family serine protease